MVLLILYFGVTTVSGSSPSVHSLQRQNELLLRVQAQAAVTGMQAPTGRPLPSPVLLTAAPAEPISGGGGGDGRPWQERNRTLLLACGGVLAALLLVAACLVYMRCCGCCAGGRSKGSSGRLTEAANSRANLLVRFLWVCGW